MLSFTPTSDTFVVEEVPAYVPSGAGRAHVPVDREARLTTFEAVRRIARACDVDARDVGYAGHEGSPRDDAPVAQHPAPRSGARAGAGGRRRARARRPPSRQQAAHRAPARQSIRGRAHRRRRRRRRARCGERADDALARDGLANRYGEQRFGATGENAAQGLAILRGERRERDHRRRRLLLSAAQSAVFNRYLELRADGRRCASLRRVRAGDVLQKTASGGSFVCTDVAIDQARVDAGEIVPTGPMPGTRVMEPPPDSEAGPTGATRARRVSARRATISRARAAICRARGGR